MSKAGEKKMSRIEEEKALDCGTEAFWNMGEEKMPDHEAGTARNTKGPLLKKVPLVPDFLGDQGSMAAYMKQMMSLAEWFGGNLDALADVLSEVTEETVFEVDVNDREVFAREDYPGKVLRVIACAAAENPHLHLYLTDPGWRPDEAVNNVSEEKRQG